MTSYGINAVLGSYVCAISILALVVFSL